MPFHRGCYLKHPQTGVEGLWIELSTDPPGTLTGLATSAFPRPVLTGPTANRDTLVTYAAKVNASLRSLVTKVGIVVVIPTITFSSLDPIIIAGIVVDEGDCMAVRVN